jgi:hypothetical protein
MLSIPVSGREGKAQQAAKMPLPITRAQLFDDYSFDSCPEFSSGSMYSI